jgi:molybdopterin-guanine dinucleotide biosynthesis protein A
MRPMVGAILAGGLGTRMGGAKATRVLAGRPLASYPAAALAAVCDRVAIVAKRDTELPRLEGVELWIEPDEPRHPLTGLIHALERAGGPVLVCAVDMPFVTEDACRGLIAAAGVAVADGRLQPLFGVYAPPALAVLRGAPRDAPLTRTVEALGPALVEVPAGVVLSVDTPEALALAERLQRR